MQTYSFDAYVGQAIAFDPTQDVLEFGSNRAAAGLSFQEDNGDLLVWSSGSFVRLSSVTFDQLQEQDFSFLDGSVVRLGSAADDSLTGTNSGDYIDIRGGGSDTVTAGAGNDRIYVGGALDASDQISGGTNLNGVDELVLNSTNGWVKTWRNAIISTMTWNSVTGETIGQVI